MKKLILALTFILQACGANPETQSTQSILSANCGGSHVNDWGRLPGPSEVLVLNADCSGVLHTGGGNQTAFTYSQISGTQVHLTYTSNGSQQICGFEILPTTLRLNCGAGWITYHAAY